jgi:CheY-like chemotaxis protein
VSELPLILVIEDEYELQGLVEDALTDGGFVTEILTSGEEALTLFKARIKNDKALVTDVSLKGHLSGWEVARQIRQINPACPVNLHDRRSRRSMGIARCSQQNPSREAVCTCTAGDGRSNLLNAGSLPGALAG